MKRARLLICAALAFAAGALLAKRNPSDALRAALAKDAPVSAQDGGIAKKSARARETSGEDRFGKLFSVQGGSRLKYQHDLYEALGDLSAAEVATMIDRAEKLPAHRGYFVTMALLERWFELDAKNARAWVRARPEGLPFWQIWAKKEPERVIAEVHLHSDLSRGDTVLNLAIAVLVGQDEKAQATCLAALPADATRDDVLVKTVADWAKTDAAGAFAFARLLPAGPLRQSTSETALREWAKADAPRAAQALVAMLPEMKTGSDGSALVAAMAGALTESSGGPRAALLWLSTLPAEQRGFAPYVSAASAWAKVDPVAALTWCRENGVDTGGRGGAVVGAAMDKHPLETVRWVQTLPAGEERDRLLERAISATSKLSFPPVTDANATLLIPNTVENRHLPKSENRRKSRNAPIRIVQSSTEFGIISLLQELPPDAQARAAFSLGWSSGHNGKLDDVRVWTERLPDGALRAAAVEAAVAYRFGANPGNREQLLAQFPNGPERDGALTGIARREYDEAPARAAQTASEITDPNVRYEVLDGIIASWLEHNPAQARTWLGGAKTLPADWTNAWLTEFAEPK